MALQKLNAFTKKVADFADKPSETMTAAEVKAQFDAAPEELRVYLNQLIDALLSTTDGDSGADQIKATPIDSSPDTVQGIMEWLKGQMDYTVVGQITDGSLPDIKLSNQPGNIKARFSSHQTDSASHGIGDKQTLQTQEKGTIVGAINELFQSANDGKTAVANAVTAKGVSASPSDTFTTLATKIGLINTGKKWATGFNVTPNAQNSITVNGLDFQPSYIFTVCPTNSQELSMHTAEGSAWGRKSVIHANGSDYATTDSDAVFNADGFTAKVSVYASYNHDWIAFE